LKTKPVTPYQRLLDDITEFCLKLKHRNTVGMLWFGKANLPTGFRLDDVYERTLAADQLGYDVVLRADDKGLHVNYVKRVKIPYEWQA
jgi:hypothetical protein